MADLRWYSLRVISGSEKKITERIMSEVKLSGWSDIVRQVVVPTEKVYKIRNGKKVITERFLLPGYLLVQADAELFTAEIAQQIASINKVINFLGGANPIPMMEAEANRMLGKADESAANEELIAEPFLVGESIKIVDGPFNDFVGDIKEINEDKRKLKVVVKIFGRGTEVELNFVQVEKQQ